MIVAERSWGIPTDLLAKRIEELEQKLGKDLLKCVLRAGKNDLWRVRVNTDCLRYLAVWEHSRAGKVVGRYTVVVERHGDTLADCSTTCTCPDALREVKRFGAWCKHELLTLFLINPQVRDSSLNFVKFICKVSEPESPSDEFSMPPCDPVLDDEEDLA